jgi:restriction endonuclease Mrr
MKERVHVTGVKDDSTGYWVKLQAANAPAGTRPMMCIMDTDTLIIEQNPQVREEIEAQFPSVLGFNDVVAICQSVATSLIKANADPNSRNKEQLLFALRHSLAGWILAEATPEQILEIVDKYKRSPFN